MYRLWSPTLSNRTGKHIIIDTGHLLIFLFVWPGYALPIGVHCTRTKPRSPFSSPAQERTYTVTLQFTHCSVPLNSRRRVGPSLSVNNALQTLVSTSEGRWSLNCFETSRKITTDFHAHWVSAYLSWVAASSQPLWFIFMCSLYLHVRTYVYVRLFNCQSILSDYTVLMPCVCVCLFIFTSPMNDLHATPFNAWYAASILRNSKIFKEQ